MAKLLLRMMGRERARGQAERRKVEVSGHDASRSRTALAVAFILVFT